MCVERYRGDDFAWYRVRYDRVFERLCLARREFDAKRSEGVNAEDLRVLEAKVDAAHAAYTRARNELANWLLQRRGWRMRTFLFGQWTLRRAAARRRMVN